LIWGQMGSQQAPEPGLSLNPFVVAGFLAFPGGFWREQSG